MATTFSTAYDNDPDGFEKRVYATLHAQSIAIAAALALAAKSSEQGDNHALRNLDSVLRELDSKERLYPINDRDRLYAQAHVGSIFAEARKIIEAE